MRLKQVFCASNALQYLRMGAGYRFRLIQPYQKLHKFVLPFLYFA